MTRPSRPASSARPLQGRGLHAWAERQRRFLRSLAVQQPLLARLAPRFVARVFGAASGRGVGFVPPVYPTRSGAARRNFVPALVVLSAGRPQLHRTTERSHPITLPEASPEPIPTSLPARVNEASDGFGGAMIEGFSSLEVPYVNDAPTGPVARSPYGEEAVPGEVHSGDLESLEGVALDEPERDVSDSGLDAFPNEAGDARTASAEDRADAAADTRETALPPALAESSLDHEDAARVPENPTRPSKRKAQRTPAPPSPESLREVPTQADSRARAPEVSVREEPVLPSIEPIKVELQESNLEPVKTRRGPKPPSAAQDSSQPQARQVLETQQVTRAIEPQPASEIELRSDERVDLEALPSLTEISEAEANGVERSTPLEIGPTGALEPTALRGSDATEPVSSEDRADSLTHWTEEGLESLDFARRPIGADAPLARTLEAEPEGDPEPRFFEPTETSPERAPERPNNQAAPVGDESEHRIKTRNIVSGNVPSESERSVDVRALPRDPEVEPGSKLAARSFEAEREPSPPTGVQASNIGTEGESRALEVLTEMGQPPVMTRTPLEAPPEAERTATGPAENASESLEVPEAAPDRTGAPKGNPLETPPQAHLEREGVPAIPPEPTPISDGAPLTENRVVETVKPRRPRPVPLAVNEARTDAQAPEPSALEAMTQDTDAIERLFRAWRRPEDRFAPSPDGQPATRFVRPTEVPEPLETRRAAPTLFERASDEPPERDDGSAPDEIAARDSDRRELPDDPLLDVLFRVWARPEDRYSSPGAASTSVGRETTTRLPSPDVAAGLEQRASPTAPPRPPLEPQRPNGNTPERHRFQAALQVNPQDGFIAESQVEGLETTPLPESARRFLHPIVGIDPTEARVQRGPLADAIADSRDADAVTLGRDVFVSSAHPDGDPQTLALLAHELTHVARGLSPRFVPPIIRDSEASESDMDGSRTASPRSSSAEEDLAERVEARALERAENRLEAGMTALDGSGEFPEFGTAISNARNTVQDGFESDSRGARPQGRESPSDPWNGLPAPWEPMPDLDFSGSSRAFSSGLELASSGAEGLTGGAGAQAASRGRNLERRAETDRREEAEEDEQGGVQQDLDGLARQVYAILKRRLEMERRRGF